MTIDPRHPPPGRRPLVVGAARSGIAAARLLAGHGLDVRVCDAGSAEQKPDAARALAALRVEVRWQSDDPSALDGRDVVVWSPGIPITHPIATAAAARGLPVLSELELGYLAAHAPLLAVTGTNGKSTTTDLTGPLLRAAGREVAVCGNIGRPICDVAESVSPSGLLVVEVSSFQLETVSRLKPFIASWLNLTPDHLDRHGSLDAYGALKRRLFERQDENDYAVWNADDAEVTKRRGGGAVALEFSSRRAVDQGAYAVDGTLSIAWRGGSERLMDTSELRIPGPHNLMNALAAVAMTLPLEISPQVLRQALQDYGGLEHRLETVAIIEGVTFVNDSKATNAGSLAVALESYDRPVVLIAGGRDKGQDFTPLRPLVQRAVHTLVLLGEAQENLAKAWPDVPVRRATSLAEAVDLAFEAARARKGAVALLSPGCASFDMFQDYEDRGRRFKAEVERLRLERCVA
jgi:UDP-N-acetylmuramoylalanine--D-glutamate ligase